MLAFAVIPVLLLSLVSSAPTSKDETIVVDEEFFPDSFSIYKSEHDIVNIMVPLNALNFEDIDSDNRDNTNLFFVEADINNGKYDYKGLYILKNGKAIKLLDNGQDASSPTDNTKEAYFGASDGIYSYNVKENKAEKYGTVTDNIIKIAKVNDTDAIYIVTADKKLFKVTEHGTKKTAVAGVENANDIVLDYSNNLYYYGDDKILYVLTSTGPKKIEGLPENSNYVKLLRPPFVVEDAVAFVSDDIPYVVSANGTSEKSDFKLKVKPTAYSMEGTLLQYYAYNKQIYEYNVLALMFGEILSEIKQYLQDQVSEIQALAHRSRNEIFT